MWGGRGGMTGDVVYKSPYIIRQIVIAHPLSSEQQQQSPCNNFRRTLARISLRSSKYSTPLACTSYGLTSIHMIQKQSLTFVFFKSCLRIIKDQKARETLHTERRKSKPKEEFWIIHCIQELILTALQFVIICDERLFLTFLP